MQQDFTKQSQPLGRSWGPHARANLYVSKYKGCQPTTQEDFHMPKLFKILTKKKKKSFCIRYLPLVRRLEINVRTTLKLLHLIIISLSSPIALFLLHRREKNVGG
jgi:hypothetical protein